MRSMQWQLGFLGTISAFAYRHRETKKNLCRGCRSQDLPNTGLQPAVQHLKSKQQYTHSTTNTHDNNTHKITTIHTRQLTTIHTRHQQYTQDKLIAFPVFLSGYSRHQPLFVMLNSLLQADEPSDEASLMDDDIQLDTFEEGFKGKQMPIAEYWLVFCLQEIYSTCLQRGPRCHSG